MPPLEPIFYLSAFFAGILMFLAPCTLPLLPAYLGFISGVTEHEIHDEKTKRRARREVLKQSGMFVLGFAMVFLSTGLITLFVGGYVSVLIGDTLKVLGGIIIILFGLFMIGGISHPFLHKERKIGFSPDAVVGKPFTSLLLGGAFAVGWSPCIGPVYGTILIYASTSETILLGMLLLLVFLAGFSIPFLLSALLISKISTAIEWVSPYLRIISIVGGFLLIILGVTLIFGHNGLTDWFFMLFEHLDFDEVLMPYL